MRRHVARTLVAGLLISGCSDTTDPVSLESGPNLGVASAYVGFRCEEGEDASPSGVNAAGNIVGSAGYEPTYGFLCDNSRGVSTDLGNLGGSSTVPAAINASGQVVGMSQTAGDSFHAFVWSRGVMTDLGTLPGDNTSGATAINARGQVVGESMALEGDGPYPSRAVLWDRGVAVNLGTLPGMTWGAANAINARGQVAGASGTAWLGSHAFLWERGRMIALPGLGGNESWARGINDAGQIVGAAQTSSGEWHAALWERGTVRDLGLGGALAINDAGVIVGFSEGGAVFWRKGVQGVLEPYDAENNGNFSAYAISPSGMVVGAGNWENGTSPSVWRVK